VNAVEQEQTALTYGPGVVLAEARVLETARGRATDASGQVLGVRELAACGAPAGLRSPS
jgi:hypothetical protein